MDVQGGLGSNPAHPTAHSKIQTKSRSQTEHRNHRTPTGKIFTSVRGKIAGHKTRIIKKKLLNWTILKIKLLLFEAR